MSATLAPQQTYDTENGPTLPVVKISPLTPPHTIVDRLRGQFGPGREIVRLGGIPVRIYCFRHPEHIAQVYTHKAIGTRKLPAMLPRVRWLMRTGTFIHPGGAQWKQRRHVLQPAFTRAYSSRFADQTAAASAESLARFDAFASEGTAFPFLKEISRAVVDVTFRTLFSTELGARLDQVNDGSRSLLEGFGARLPVWIPTRSNLQFRRTSRELQQIVADVVAARQRAGGSHDDILDLMLSATDEQGRRWSADDVQDEVFSIYLGATIMGVVQTWTALALDENPDVLARLTDEVDRKLAGRPPTCADLDELRYPLMVFQETTRLYPPVWGIPRWANQAVRIADVDIPAHSLLLPVGYYAHRHPDYWERPDEFDVERFAPERAGRIHPFAHYPFGGGPRMCLGRNLAPLVCQLLTILLVQRYRLEVVRRFPGDPQIRFDFEVRPEADLLVRLTRR